MKSIVAKKIFEAGAKKRNPSLFKQYDVLKETEWLSRAQLEKLQLEKTAKFLQFAERNSSFYRKLFEESGFSASRFSGLDDLKFIPEIDKDDLVKKNREIHSEGIDESLKFAETSGTSGKALSFYRNEKWDSTNRALLMRSYDWYGVKPWDRNGYLWGYNNSPLESAKIKMLDSVQNRFRLFRYSNDEIRRFCKKLVGATFISGYSSMIYEIARSIEQLNLGPIPLKMVKGTSEMILDVYQPYAKSAFGKKIISEYGAAESGLIAFECPYGNMHVNIENVVLEKNHDGEILVTNLSSFSFPIIRYRLGDSVSMSGEFCPCGRAHPIIREIAGRQGAKVIGRGDTYPALTFYYVFKNLALEENILLNYKAVQEVPGSVDLLIEGKSNTVYIPKINAQLKKYFNSDISFSIRFVEEFSLERKKSQYFESFL